MKTGTDLAFDLLLSSGTSLGEVRVRDSDVRAPAGPVLHGLEVNGLRHLLVPLTHDQHPTEDRKSAGVQIRVRRLIESSAEHRYLDVVCLLPHLNQLFSIVSDEMLAGMAEHSAGAPEACQLVLNRWRELLERPAQPLLGPERQAALLAELAWVEKIARVNPQRALDVWRGPLNDRHDFVASRCAVEVKSTLAREGRLIEIHGERQLEADVPLYLAIHRYEQREPGATIPASVAALVELGVDRLRLLKLLARIGFDERDAEVYRNTQFKETEFRAYAVSNEFPRIVPSSFRSGSVPERIMTLRYTIDLEGEPPVPLDSESLGEVIECLAAHAPDA